MVLWASRRLSSLLTEEEQKTRLGAVLGQQKPDGVWWLVDLACCEQIDDTWKRGSGKLERDQPLRISEVSDGFAAAFFTYVLKQRGRSRAPLPGKSSEGEESHELVAREP